MKIAGWTLRFRMEIGVSYHGFNATNHEEKYGDFSRVNCHWIITLTPNGAKTCYAN